MRADKDKKEKRQKIMAESTQDFRDNLYLEDLPQLDKEMVEDAVYSGRSFVDVTHKSYSNIIESYEKGKKEHIKNHNPIKAK